MRLLTGLVLLGMFSGTALAQPPSVSAPALAWRPVTPHGGFAAYKPVPTPTLPPIVDLRAPVTPAPRPVVPVPTSRLIEVGPTKAPATSRSLTGKASWYCGPTAPICAKGYPMGGAYAAAGPRLRAAICGVQSCTSWRGKTVSVNGIPVKLIDWCQCYWKQAHEKVIDLYHNVFAETGGNVTIRW